MIYTKERLLLLQHNLKMPPSQHGTLSAERLALVSAMLDKKGIEHVPDPEMPFHLIVKLNRHSFSIYCGGMHPYYMVIELNTSLEETNETGCKTPLSVIHCIEREAK